MRRRARGEVKRRDGIGRQGGRGADQKSEAGEVRKWKVEREFRNAECGVLDWVVEQGSRRNMFDLHDGSPLEVITLRCISLILV